MTPTHEELAKGGHHSITWAAMQALPPPYRALWDKQIGRMALEYALYGDLYMLHRETIGKYVILPSGSEPRWGIGTLRHKHHIAAGEDYWESPFYDNSLEVFIYFLAQISEHIRNGSLDEAARYAGAIAHHIQDSGVPAHAVDNFDLEFVKDYLSCPDWMASFPLHKYTELPPGVISIDGYTPSIMGSTPEEAATAFVHRHIELTLHARRLLFPMVQCAIAGDDNAAQKLRVSAAEMCAKVFCDFMHTATHIALKDPSNITDGDSEFCLFDKWPYRMTAWAPAPYWEPGPMQLVGINIDGNRKPVACSLRDNGDMEPKVIKKSLGAGSNFMYQYKFAKNVFYAFKCRVGPHASLGIASNVEVQIRTADKSVYSHIFAPSDLPVDITVPIGGSEDVFLMSNGPHWKSPDAANCHIVWDNPRVCR